jgi:hypothetical protein|tara:strand:+ start:1377 stop:1778 length:402 start_codon:yes stop_codon:yes gene_type:complete
MAYARARQERYVKTANGKVAHLRSCTKDREKKQQEEGGRLELRLRKIRSERGEAAAVWFEKQKPMCKICGKTVHKAPENSKDKQNQAVIDHDHKTGKLRGLLCHQCNVGIGNFKDDINRLMNAILYLLKAKKK